MLNVVNMANCGSGAPRIPQFSSTRSTHTSTLSRNFSTLLTSFSAALVTFSPKGLRRDSVGCSLAPDLGRALETMRGHLDIESGDVVRRKWAR